MKPSISLIASAARPQFWMRLYNSLLVNKISFEIVFVGPNAPNFTLPENFRFYLSNCKPAQCYQSATFEAEGEVIGWMADDCDYNEPKMKCPNALDLIWAKYNESCNQYDDTKTIISQRTIEDYGSSNMVDWNNHRFFYGRQDTPQMAPLGFMNRAWFNHLGGYDKNFVCGQSENDVVQRGLQDGGRVVGCPESLVFLHHRECHGEYSFRHGYQDDRRFLETCWVKEGYGTYETRKPYTMLSQRSRPVECFEKKDILVSNQGPAGRWA